MLPQQLDLTDRIVLIHDKLAEQFNLWTVNQNVVLETEINIDGLSQTQKTILTVSSSGVGVWLELWTQYQ